MSGSAGQDVGGDDAMPDEDLELAYQRALSVIDAIDVSLAGEAEATIPFPGAAPAGSAERPSAPEPAPDSHGGGSPRIEPRQVIEAVLFVGGEPMTTRKLCSLFREQFEAGFVDRQIEELNACYAAEERPYEIRLGEGGYRMELRAEFARVRSRAYGLAPKEVKLSRDALEILALIAYRQPITKRQIEEAGKPNAGGVLSQLLRRELVAIDRQGPSGKQVAYRTTKRFLRLFGLGKLDELPQADELNFK